MTDAVRLLWRCTRHQNRIFWRTPVGAFFTLVFPVVMLVVFTAIFGNDELDTVYGTVTTSQFYTPGLAVFAAASATYTGIGITVASRRELGILKRVRGTPLPPWVYLAGVVVSGVWIAAVAVAAMTALGVVVYGVSVEAAKAPAMILAFLVGSATLASLGLAVASLARTVAAAVPLAQATILPVAFVSDIFVPLGDDPPRWLDLLGGFFPLKHFGLSYGQAMSPLSEAPAIEWHRLAVMLVWMAVGAAVVAWRFTWDPPVKTSRSRPRRAAGQR